MSEFVAGAFVDVQPDGKGFRAELKRIVDNAIKNSGAFKVPIEVDPKRFKSTIQAAVRGAPLKVQVEPSMNKAEFRAAVSKKIKEATAGLKVTIPVETGTVTKARGKAAAPAAPAPGVVDQQIAGQIPLPGLQRDAQAQAAGLESATRSGTEAKKAAVGATKKLTEEELRANAVKKALTTATEQEATARHLLTAAGRQGIPIEEKATLQAEARAAASKGAKAANDLLATSAKHLNDEDRAAVEAAARKASATRQEVTDLQKVTKTQAAGIKLQEQTLAARTAAVEPLAREIKGIATLNELSLVENELSSVDARLKAQLARARKLNATETVDEITATRALIAAQKAEIVTQRENLKGEGKRARNQKTATRGGFATILNLLGVRGATLAASSAFLVGAAAVGIFAKSLAVFAKFETELNTFKVIAGATAAEMAEVSKKSKELGADISLPAVSAADAAQAMTELSRAGLDVQDSMDGARGVLELAAAAQISNAEAATLTASALNAFGLSGDKAVHVADLLANAANAAQGSISEMGAAMQQASAIARQVGLSLDNTVAILTLFARNGLRGSDAGTSLRTALSRLIAPTKNASALIEALGLNIRDANGNIRPDIFAQFGEATANISPALRDMIAETLAGQDAIRAFAIGAREGARGLKLAQLQMAQEGTAAQVAAARTKGLAGAFSAAGSNAETLGIQLGGFASGPVKDVVGGLNDILVRLNLLAEGDFEGLGDKLKGDLDTALDTATRRVEGFRDLGQGLGEAIFGGDLDNISLGIAELTKNAPDATDEIAKLTQQLDDLQKQRIREFELHIGIGETTKEINLVRKQLKALGADAADVTPLTAFEKATKRVRDTLKEAQRLRKVRIESGKETTGLDKSIAELKKRLANAGEIRLQIKGLQGAKDPPGPHRPVPVDVDTEGAKKKIKELRRQAVNELLGLAADSEKAVSASGVAKSFTEQFRLIALAPETATPQVLRSFKDMFGRLKNAAKGQGELFTIGEPKGLLNPGNLDLLHRKLVKVGGGVATLRSISVRFTKDELPASLQHLADKEVLIPTVFDGKALKGSAKEIQKQAAAHFLKTGEFLGAFASVGTANAYAETLHQQQAKLTGAFASVTKAAQLAGGQLSGETGKRLAIQIVKTAQAAINAAVKADNPDLADAIKVETDRIMTIFNVKARESFKSLVVPFTGEELAAQLLPGEIATSKADAFGSTADQIATRERELAKLRQQRKSIIPGSAEEKANIDAQKAKQDEIDSIREQAASDREQAASDAKEARDKSDQKVLDAMSPEERKRQNALVVAQATESLADDIKREEALRDLYLQQIDTIPKTVKGDEARRDALAEANQNLFSIEQDIIRDRAARRKQIRDLHVKGLDEAAERAAESETLADDQNEANRKVAFWKGEVKRLKRLVRLRKATLDELRDAQADLDDAEDAAREVRRDRRQQIADLKAERLDLRIQIAQDTGNKNAEIAARKLQIKNTEKLISQTKKGTIARLRLKAQLAQEKKELKDLQDAVDETKKGTTAFDILKEAAETFKQTGGNLINGAQPFTGPSGFTADIAQWLLSQKSVAGTLGPQAPPIPPKLTVVQRNDPAPFDRLVTALNANTDALTGRGNRPTGKKGVGINVGATVGLGAYTGPRFWDSAEARRDGGGGTGGV